jgi:hypothetical protein
MGGFLRKSGMAIKTLTNEDGETIELQRAPGGGIQIRHSDITGEAWGEYDGLGKMTFNGDTSILSQREIEQIQQAIEGLE